MQKKWNYSEAVRFLSKYMKNYKKRFWFFYTGWLIESVLEILLPVLLGIMIDEIIYYRNMTGFIRESFIYLICIIFSSVLYFFIYVQHGYLMNMFVFGIRREVFEHWQKCNASFLTDASTGEILAIIQKYPEECMHFIIRNIIHLTNSALMIVIYTGYLIKINIWAGIIVFVVSVFSVFVNTGFSSGVRDLGIQERNKYGLYISWLYEVLTALKDIRLLGAVKKIKRRFKEEQETLFHIKFKTEIRALAAQNVILFIHLVVRLILYVLAAYLIFDGSITLGVLTVVFRFYDELSGKINYVCTNYLDAQKRLAYIQKIRDFLEVPTEKDGKKILEISDGEIEFLNLTFGYENKEKILKNISMKIKSGERIALVGKSGCGKTTLGKLLIGFFQPSHGSITIDGQDTSECKLTSLREKIGYVRQEVLLFDGTIRQNILLGNLRASEEQIWNACEAAGIREYIFSLPKGLDTVIGSYGMGLSGGQKQRIAIARIYLKNPDIIIFDEATSALDKKTEAVIHQAWNSILKGKNAIVITHRKEALKSCDRVLLLEDGRIAESNSCNRVERKMTF